MCRQDELLSKATDSRSRFGLLRALCASTSLAGLFADGGTVLQDVETNTGGEWFFVRSPNITFSVTVIPFIHRIAHLAFALQPCERCDGPLRSFLSTRGITTQRCSRVHFLRFPIRDHRLRRRHFAAVFDRLFIDRG